MENEVINETATEMVTMDTSYDVPEMTPAIDTGYTKKQMVTIGACAFGIGAATATAGFLLYGNIKKRKMMKKLEKAAEADVSEVADEVFIVDEDDD